MTAGAPIGAASPAPMPAAPADERVRERIRTDLDTTLIIEAAAGTGKTTALVSRIVAVIAAGRTTLERIVAVTFTEKAAGELKLRLRAEIERARQSDPEPAARARLTDSLPRLEQAHIGTIHSFCADLLRERPIATGVDPMFEVAAEDLTAPLFEAAFERWFEDALANPGEALRRILRRRDLADREGPRPLLIAAARALVEWRDFDAPWRYEPFDRDRAIDALAEEIEALGELATEGEPDDWMRKALEEIRRPIGEATRLESVRDRDYDALEDALLRLVRGNHGRWRWRGSGRGFGTLARADVIARRDALKRRLDEFRDLAGANLAPQLRDELWPVVAYYRAAKARAGRLDFLDLLLTARDLVRDQPALRAELQDRFSHIFIDEFQDTDPLQAEILLLLAADDPRADDWLAVRPRPGKLFIVGDPKQSIYRFRRADVALYQSVKRRLLERGAALEQLTVSFRATPEIQALVNAAFAPLMAAESPTQPAYAALEAYRADYPAQPAIVALPVPSPYGDYGRIVKWRIDESLPEAIAAFVKWLVGESGWTVTERESAGREPIRPRHICILFRRFNSYGRDVTRPYVRALEARQVAHVLVRGGSLHRREEAEALRNALGAIERPDDELAVFATLHGPFFAIADGPLLQFRETVGTLHPFRPLAADLAPELGPIALALGVLRELHRGRNRRPIAETIARLLAATRAHAGVAIWPTGEQALANLMRLMDLARRYESRGGATSLRGFVDELEARAEREEAGEAPVVEEGTEGVRIMTVHRAKGLEFPVVILADLTCNETAGEAHRFVDPERRLCAQRLGGCAPRELLDHAPDEQRRDTEEAIRLLYVATTRARDLIVAPVVGDERQAGWLARLDPVLYPDPRNARTPVARGAPGGPAFAAELAGDRPANAVTRGAGVTPGTHRPEAGAHRVVWWDPSILTLDVREMMGLRQRALLEADAGTDRSERGQRAYDAWRAERAATIAVASVPALRVTTPTELAASANPPALPEADAIEIVEVARPAGRPHGAVFGTLVHAILSRVALDAGPGAIAAAANFFGRTLGASADEIIAAAEAVRGALKSPLMRRAAAAPAVRRETPLILTLADHDADDADDADRGGHADDAKDQDRDRGEIVEGVADLAFIEEFDGVRRWTVVDFKTDLELVARLGEYRVQLALYVRAIHRATGMPAHGILLWL